MRAERGAVIAYFTAIAMLAAAATGFRVLIDRLNIFLLKERVELRRRLDSIPTKLGDWERVGEDTNYPDTMLEELGTRSYLDRIYALNGSPEKGVLHVHVAYYTGSIDAVPHIPERCWAVSGLELTRNSEGTPLDVDRSGWVPLEPPASSGEPYLMAAVIDPITAERERVTMPLGDIVATTIEFQDPKDPQRRQVGGYFFIANGRLTATSYGVRALAFNLTDRYAYYCKIQLTKSRRISETDASLMQPFVEESSDILTHLLPEVMRCLPDWPEWEARSRGLPAGGTQD